ncbi:MAG: TlpA disulfide reductase family protein [Thiohalophilus sp.]|jgi:thiol-disulfide isomerase/thioredoxin
MTIRQKHHNILSYVLASLFLVSTSGISLAAEIATVTSDDGTEISYERYPGKTNKLFIWLPSEYGRQPAEQSIAERLSRAGHETWLVDLFEARFLPPTVSSLDRIPGSDVRSLINAARPQQREVYLISNSGGVRPLLRGLHAWQLEHPGTTHTPSVILFSPEFYYETPDPGQEPQLLPITRQTNAPIFIFQPSNSPWRWKLDETLPALEQAGSDVFYRLLPGVRDRFYFRPDATAKEQALEQELPELIRQATLALQGWPPHARYVEPLQDRLAPLSPGKKDRTLKPYAGNPLPPHLQLPGLQGSQYDLTSYRGSVVLVNFWASWCPPCVHEMPSMQSLSNRLSDKPFALLAVNMAEKPETIEEFLNDKIKVNFPILLDSDGKALKNWGVFAFPTSYVIDKKGHIRYALFGSVDWNSEDIVSKIELLLKE